MTRLLGGGTLELPGVMRRIRGIDVMGRLDECGAVVHLSRFQRIAVGTRAEGVR
jgi:hypothetical protein